MPWPTLATTTGRRLIPEPPGKRALTKSTTPRRQLAEDGVVVIVPDRREHRVLASVDEGPRLVGPGGLLGQAAPLLSGEPREGLGFGIAEPVEKKVERVACRHAGVMPTRRRGSSSDDRRPRRLPLPAGPGEVTGSIPVLRGGSPEPVCQHAALTSGRTWALPFRSTRNAEGWPFRLTVELPGLRRRG